MTTETTMTWDAYECLQDAAEWGCPVSDAEHDAACERMNAWLATRYPHITARPARAGECAGVYGHDYGRDRQILGHSLPVPDAVKDAVAAAWEYACETWPTDPCRGAARSDGHVEQGA